MKFKRILPNLLALALVGCGAANPPGEKIGSSENATGSLFTTYADGRQSEVRVRDYFDFYRDKNSDGRAAPKLILAVVEWGRFDAIVVDKNAAIAQLPSNRMAGGDVEENAKVGPQSKAFFQRANAAFNQRSKALTRIGGEIPNRNVEYVSFDFVTDQGSFTVQERRSTLENGDSPWSALFKDALALREAVQSSSRQNP